MPRIGVGPNGDVYATWETCIGLNACEMELIAAAHLGEDGTWGDPVILNVRNSANGSTPDVAVDENGVGHFVWTDSGRVGGRDGSANVVYTTWDGTAPTISDASCNNAGATPQPQSPETPGVCWAGFMQTQGGLGDVTSLTSQGISGMDATYPRIAVGSMGPQVVFVVDTQSENTGRAYEVYLATSQKALGRLRSSRTTPLAAKTALTSRTSRWTVQALRTSCGKMMATSTATLRMTWTSST